MAWLIKCMSSVVCPIAGSLEAFGGRQSSQLHGWNASWEDIPSGVSWKARSLEKVLVCAAAPVEYHPVSLQTIRWAPVHAFSL